MINNELPNSADAPGMTAKYTSDAYQFVPLPQNWVCNLKYRTIPVNNAECAVVNSLQTSVQFKPAKACLRHVAYGWKSSACTNITGKLQPTTNQLTTRTLFNIE
jgi:hypothetical protein